MSNKSIISIFYIVLFSVFCLKAYSENFPTPWIQEGVAKIEGKVINYTPDKNGEQPTVVLAVPLPVTAELGIFKAPLSENGDFYFEVPVECNHSIASIGSKMFDKVINIDLMPGKTSKIEIMLIDKNNIRVNLKGYLDLTSDELFTESVFGKFLEARDFASLYKMSPEEFSSYALHELMPKRIKRTISDSIPERARNFVANECQLYYLKGTVLVYREYMERNYKSFKPSEEQDTFVFRNPTKSYYSFLKDFNLGNPQYLYNQSYSLVLESLLANETLNIPAIGDTPVFDWLAEVKTKISDLVGNGNDLFYEILAANAYARQFKNELKPLSDKQKNNIRNYFKADKAEIAKILFKKNEGVIQLEKEKNYYPVMVNSTPMVDKKELLKSIVSKYRGKIVLVDFWATWCGPCINAIKEIREVKSKMSNKNVAFVYITNTSSPKKLWDEKIKAIGGEHYYLSEEEMEYITKSVGFEAIPTYLLYDKEGVLKSKFTSYPGNEKLYTMLNELLKK